MSQGEAQLALAQELGGVGGVSVLGGVAITLAQDLERDDLARLAVYGAEDAGEGAGPHRIQHFVGAAEEARPLALGQAVELVVGHVLAAEEEILDLFDGGARPTAPQTSWNCRWSSSSKSSARCIIISELS